MKTSFLLLACACSLGQPNSRSEWQLAPQLAPGQELVYAGTCVEESLVPNVQFQRHYRLETLVFVLGGAPGRWDVAVMTALSQRTTRAEPEGNEMKLVSVRLEQAHVNAQGKLTQAGTPLLPLSGPPTFETGCFVEVTPARLTKSSLWEVNEDNRPPRTWRVAGLEAVNGVTCVKVIGQQQSPDWDKPRGDRTAWRRRDVVWIAPQLGVAQKVERVIEQRDPLRRDPTQRVVVQYELQSPFRYRGPLFEDRKQEIAKVRKFQDDAALLLKQPAQNRAQLDALLKKVSLHVESHAPTPYRKAVVHLASRIEHAKNGNAVGDPTIDDNPRPATAVGLGQRVPDFVVNQWTGNKQSARLARMLGRPVLVFFYVPTTDTGKEILQFAKSLVQQHGDKVGIMAMAVSNDPNSVRKQHGDLQLPFPVLDGGGMRLTFGVDATPRLVLLDPEGHVRFAATGWGFHVPREIQDELQRWLRK